MPASASRIRRLLADELTGCRDEDIEQRLNELRSLADRTFENDPTRPIFAVLGNETRYRLARTLSATENELCVCELEPLVDVSESAISHALSDLVDAGLVSRRKEGNWRYYRTTDLAETLFDTAAAAVSDNE